MVSATAIAPASPISLCDRSMLRGTVEPSRALDMPIVPSGPIMLNDRLRV